MKAALYALLTAALGTFMLGVFAPMATFEKFYIFDNQYSLCTALINMFEEREIFLFGIILLFSVLFPFFKIMTLFSILTLGGRDERLQKQLRVLEFLGKWSMLDVFVVAFLVMTVKLRAIANVEIHQGIYWFTASVVLTMTGAHLLMKMVQPKS